MDWRISLVSIPKRRLSRTIPARVSSAPCLGIPKRSSRGICRLECTAFAAELVALGADAILAHGAGPVECCKTIFAAQNNDIDSEMNAACIDSFTENSRECRFGHRLREGGRISEIAQPRRGYEYAATDQESVDASSRQDRTSYQVQHRMGSAVLRTARSRPISPPNLFAARSAG